jgi:hypothetical protein
MLHLPRARLMLLALAAVSLAVGGCSGGSPPQEAPADGVVKGLQGQYYYVNIFTPPIGGIISSDIGGINCGASGVSVVNSQYVYA